MSGQGFRGDSFHVKVVQRLATFVSMAGPVRVLEQIFRAFYRTWRGRRTMFRVSSNLSMSMLS